MVKFIFSIALFSFFSMGVIAQQETREELEKQRLQLKKEMEQTEKMLSANKAKTKENLVQWKLINDKVNLQDRIIDNISRDINLLNNNIYTLQRDINRYDKLLDTLKEEYAKSMVYAYKNRSNYDFLNFIFSAGSFNDAIRRITYLKNYRAYREKQGENILRTQELRRQRIEELGGAKQKKSIVLQTKDKEMAALEVQKQEKDRIMNELKKQGKQLNNQLTAYKKQLRKVDNARAAVINEAKRLALKKAKDDETQRLALEKENNKANANPANTTTKSVAVSPKKEDPKKYPESILLNAENIALNMSFEKNRGSLPWPVDKGVTIMHYGANKLPSGAVMDITGLSVASDIGTSVKSVFDGIVSSVAFIEDMQVVTIQHGKYFSTYSNLGNVSVQRGQNVKTGQVIGKVAANLDGIGAIDFFIYDEKKNFDPERWLRSR